MLTHCVRQLKLPKQGGNQPHLAPLCGFHHLIQPLKILLPVLQVTPVIALTKRGREPYEGNAELAELLQTAKAGRVGRLIQNP